MTTLVAQTPADQTHLFHILFRFSTGVTPGPRNPDGSLNHMYHGVPLKDMRLPKAGSLYAESYDGCQELIRDIDAYAGKRGE